MRKRIFEVIEPAKENDRISFVYDCVMLVAIVASVIPLMFTSDNPVFKVIETITVSLFILDYILRWITADYRLGKKRLSFAVYPFTGWAIVDMLSILPGLSILSRGFKIFRMTRLLRILRVFKLFRYSDKIQILGRVVRKEKGSC